MTQLLIEPIAAVLADQYTWLKVELIDVKNRYMIIEISVEQLETRMPSHVHSISCLATCPDGMNVADMTRRKCEDAFLQDEPCDKDVDLASG